MSSRAWSTVFPLVRTYRAPSPSTRASSATDRTRSFLWVMVVVASLDQPARYRRALTHHALLTEDSSLFSRRALRTGHGTLHRPDRRGQHLQPVHATAQLGGVPGPGGGDHVVGRD